MSVLGCGICLSHPYRTSPPRKVLNFHFFAYSDPRPGGHFRAMSGPAAGRVFYTTFPAPDMARKRTLGKLTIEPVDVGGPKLTKPWVHCPMGIVPLAGVVRALWASGRDILGRCGTSVHGRFGPVSETIRGPQAPCCAGRAARPVGGLKPCVVPPYAASWSGVVMVAWWARYLGARSVLGRGDAPVV